MIIFIQINIYLKKNTETMWIGKFTMLNITSPDKGVNSNLDE